MVSLDTRLSDRDVRSLRTRIIFRRLLALISLFTLPAILALPVTASANSSPFSGHSPGHNTIVTVAPRVAIHVSTSNDLNGVSVSARLNDTPVPASFEPRTHWVPDEFGEPGDTTLVTDLRQGTITVHAPPLGNGTNRVEVSISDVAGNLFQDTWTFIMAVAPVISDPLPTGGIRERTPLISAKIAPGGTPVDSASIVLQLNGQTVSHHFNQATGLITHTPPTALTDGNYQVRLGVRDLVGNTAARDWHFTVDATPPSLSGLLHFRDGMTISDGRLIFSARLNDFSDIRDNAVLSLNGVPLPLSFEFPGIWIIDYYESRWQVTSRREANISHFSLVPDGSHTLTLRTEDILGNVRVDTWTFRVSVPPVISDPLPTGGIRERTPLISAKIAPGGTPVDSASIVLQLNGQTVSHHFDPATGLVTHTPLQPLTDGSCQVRLTVRDLAGNTAARDWHFLVDTTPPSLSSLLHFRDGMTISDGRLILAARLNDFSDIRDNAALSLNGVPLPINFSYPGFWLVDYYETQWQVTSRREANIGYYGRVPNGSHTLTLRTEDLLGNVRVDNWTFSVSSAPLITDPRPVAYGIREFKPLISAKVAGVGAAVDSGSIVLQLNGQTVSHNFDPATGLVTHTPPEPLANESYHEVTLTVRDLSGLPVQESWRFHINTFPDMADSNIAGCLPCHRLYPSLRSAGPVEDIHSRRLSFYGDHEQHKGSPPWDCHRCHNYIDAPAECWQCHGDYLSGQYDAAPHGSRPDIRPRAINYDPHFPVRVLQSREPWDCVICHQPGSGLALNHHDLPVLHKVESGSCNSCHARSLTREHAREGRLDADNRPITCSTCHQSTDEAVRTAIASRDKSCAACHPPAATGAAHAELHVVRYGSACVGCHGDNMMTEPVYHNNNCDSCHASTSPRAQSAIQRQVRSCFGCHNEPHGVFMSAIPADIPLHPGVSWSAPQAAGLWNAEGWLPDALNNPAGRVIFSSRATLEAGAVYAFYRAEMESAGWVLQSDSYKPGDQDFTLHYTKGRRHCTVWFYSGSQPGIAGQNPQGRRLQIAYH